MPDPLSLRFDCGLIKGLLTRFEGQLRRQDALPNVLCVVFMSNLETLHVGGAGMRSFRGCCKLCPRVAFLRLAHPSTSGDGIEIARARAAPTKGFIS